MVRYSGGIFIRISSTDETKYIPFKQFVIINCKWINK